MTGPDDDRRPRPTAMRLLPPRRRLRHRSHRHPMVRARQAHARSTDPQAEPSGLLTHGATPKPDLSRQTVIRFRVFGVEVASLALEVPGHPAVLEVGGVVDRGVKSVGRWYVGRMSR